jgi:hypothetical protein
VRQASAFADARDVFSVGAGRPMAEGLLGPNSFGPPGRPVAEGPSRPDSSGVPRAKRRPSPTQGMFFRSAQADRWPEALAPIEIGLLAALARQASAFADARDVFPVGVGRPLAEGPSRPDSSGVPRAKRRPSPTRKVSFRSAQADRWPRAFSGRIHSARQADRRPKALRGRIHSTHKALAPMKDPGGQPESAGRLYSQPESANRRNARGGGGWRGRCSR